ncbi:hypothetical protein F511_43528 [Dorcoceras hygrometricum]|uniref:Uncharacterized protein n=1 Tax=Dorcoceras hygrometricum TaxID=472368 RepID=A0A2Z6ZYM8_9LAMI|nr:hypothetical protein F511_43528 [Dorcoceras hygrometricum]
MPDVMSDARALSRVEVAWALRLTKFGYINWRRLWETLNKEDNATRGRSRLRGQEKRVARGRSLMNPRTRTEG